MGRTWVDDSRPGRREDRAPWLGGMPAEGALTGERSYRWPAAVRAELPHRRDRLEGSVPGARVLDLVEAPARRLVIEAARDPGLISADADRYDAVISVAALVVFPDLPLAVRGIERLLDPAGAFLFVEPVLHPGWRGVLRATAGAALPAVRDQHVGRDVPLAVRRGGFIITDQERFTMPTPYWPLRPFVQGRARRAVGFLGR